MDGYRAAANDQPPPQVYTLSLHDALPISWARAASWRRRMLLRYIGAVRTAVRRPARRARSLPTPAPPNGRSEEHTSELQSRRDLVCRLLLEKKKSHKGTPVQGTSAVTAMC